MKMDKNENVQKCPKSKMNKNENMHQNVTKVRHHSLLPLFFQY